MDKKHIECDLGTLHDIRRCLYAVNALAEYEWQTCLCYTDYQAALKNENQTAEEWMAKNYDRLSGALRALESLGTCGCYVVDNLDDLLTGQGKTLE